MTTTREGGREASKIGSSSSALGKGHTTGEDQMFLKV